MNIAHPVPSTVTSISFSFFTTEDVRRISVKQITNPVLLDDLNRPNVGGLYDPSLGPAGRQDMYVASAYNICISFERLAVAQHVNRRTTAVLDTLDILSCHPPSSTRCSCKIHTISSARLVFSVTTSNLAGQWYVLSFLSCIASSYEHEILQLIKYAAKLRLLEHGLLEAAKGLDDLQMKVKMRKGEEEDDTPEETEHEWAARINLYVQIQLMRASGSKRDNYKDSLVFQARKDLITEFLRTALTKKCSNTGCGAYVVLLICLSCRNDFVIVGSGIHSTKKGTRKS